MSEAIDYSKWDMVDDGDADSMSNSGSPVGVGGADSKAMKTLLFTLQYKANELFEESSFALAEQTYHDVLHRLLNLPADLDGRLEGQGELFVSCSMNRIACQLKQSQHPQAIASCAILNKVLVEQYAAYQLPVDRQIRLLYFQAYASLCSQHQPTDPSDRTELTEPTGVSALVSQMKDLLSVHPQPPALMRDYHELWEIHARREAQLVNQAVSELKRSIGDALPKVKVLVKDKQYDEAAAVLLALARAGPHADTEEVAVLNARLRLTAARIHLLHKDNAGALTAIEPSLQLLGQLSAASLSIPLLHTLSSLLQLQWTASRQAIHQVERMETVAKQMEKALIPMLADSATEGWAVPWGLLDDVLTEPTVGSMTVALLGQYDILSSHLRDASNFTACSLYLLRMIHLCTACVPLVKPARTREVFQRSLSTALYALAAVALQGVQVAAEDNVFPTNGNDEVEELLGSARVRSKELFASRLLEASAHMAFDLANYPLAFRASKQCGELLLDAHQIKAFGLSKVDAEGGERCHDIWRHNARCVDKIILSLQQTPSASISSDPKVAQAIVQQNLHKVIALYQAGLSILSINLEAAQRALESAAEVRSAIEGQVEQQDFWLNAGDLSYHLAQVYLKQGQRQYLREEVLRCERYYHQHGDTSERQPFLTILQAWESLLVGNVAEAERKLDKLKMGPVEDCLDQEKEIRRKIAEMKAEQARVSVPVSAARKPTEASDGASGSAVEELEEESAPLLDSAEPASEAAKLDKDQLIAYAVLFVVLVVIATLLCRVYRTVS